MVTPAGIIAEPLDLFRKVIESTAQWKAWAGPDSVHLSENRTQIENDGGLFWINTELTMPFSIIWMPQLEFMVRRCLRSYTLIMMVQDKATDRQNHNESANTYATNIGVLLDEIDEKLRAADKDVPNVERFSMISDPTRVEISQSEVEHDYWTSAFKFEVPA